MVMVDEWTMVARIALAAVLGFVLGLEREKHGRAAGLRTCVLVSLAAALLISLSIHLSQMFSSWGEGSVIRMDPGRLASYAIAGMGFLGAGAIIQGRGSAIGVTTAATLWTCTGIGLAVGAGLYIPAFVTVILAFACLSWLKKFAGLQNREQNVSLTVKLSRNNCHEEIKKLLKEYGAEIRFVSREHLLKDESVQFTYAIIIPSGSKWGQLLERLEELPGVMFYCWEEAKVV